ncbi:MAG: sigma-54 dependent transcriptional regulator [Planctomycetota bacterium]
MATILVIEDEPILARNICDALTLAGHEVSHVSSGEEGLKTAKINEPDIVLLDYRLPGIDGLETLRKLRQSVPASAVIMMTAHGGVSTAVEAMKSGASDFLTKPMELEELRLVVDRVRKNQSAIAELTYYRERELVDGAFTEITGESPAMRQVKSFVERITSTPALGGEAPPSILITGETGTGKDLIARAVHSAGPRRHAQFVHVNCTAMPEHLVESELFGHTKGAFTGALTDKRGLFEIADGGTIFLDEIGHMPLALQAKLLSVLERRVIRPVGGTRERKVNVHVLAATHRHLIDAITEGEFREDLYHRLRVLTIFMPPLRERGDDVPLLADRFLRRYAVQFRTPAERFSQEALDLIRDYDWPGNVRELLHAVESAVLMADGGVIGVEHLNIKIPETAGKLRVQLTATNKVIELDFREEGPKLEEIENQIIQATLESAGHNLTRASRILGISRDAIRYRLERFKKRAESNEPLEES